VTLLDAYALVAFLVGGPASAEVRRILREGDAGLAAANLAEALDVAARRFELPIGDAFGVLEPLLDGPLAVRPLDVPIARRAAELRARHYHRSTRPISLADAVLVASAQSGDRIATADPDVLAVAEVEGIATNPLPEQG
jgi:predicted nucleic acid-binding protein